MLCSQNSGKYLSGTWHKDVERADQNVDQFDSAKLSFLEMDGTLNGPIGELKQFDSTMNVGVRPVDPQDRQTKDYDWRREPEVQ